MESRAAFVKHQGCAEGRKFGDGIGAGLGLGRQETGEQEAISRQAGQGQRGDRGAGTGDGVDRMTGTPRGADQLVAGIGNERGAGVADQRHHLAPEPSEDPVAFGLARMIVIDRHRRRRRHVSKQFGGDALVLGKDQGCTAQGFGSACGQVGKIADRGRHDIQAGSEWSRH